MRIGDAGIVDQAIDVAELRQCGIDEAPHAGLGGHIQAPEQHALAGIEFGHAGAPGLGIQIAERDPAASAQHCLHHAAADALGAAGDQDHAIVQRQDGSGGWRWGQGHGG